LIKAQSVTLKHKGTLPPMEGVEYDRGVVYVSDHGLSLDVRLLKHAEGLYRRHEVMLAMPIFYVS
jgi:hypothetical protein